MPENKQLDSTEMRNILCPMCNTSFEVQGDVEQQQKCTNKKCNWKFEGRKKVTPVKEGQNK